MKKLNLIFFITTCLFVACSPQVTVMAPGAMTVTLTPAPTPTLHPEFAALQKYITDSGDRFSLRADGLIYDGETPIPGLTVAPNGAMTLNVNGKEITLDPVKAVFDDEDGFSYPGYKWDATANDGAGAWVEAESPAMQQTNKLIETYGLEEQVANEEIIVVEEGGAVNVVKKGTGEEPDRVLIRTIGEASKFDLGFAVDTIAKNSCEPTDFIPTSHGLMPGKYGLASAEYLTGIKNDLDYYSLVDRRKLNSSPVLIDRERQCWGYTDGLAFLYRDKDGVAQRLDLMPITPEELAEFMAESR